MPYADDSFDVVLNLNMVHLVEDPVRMLNEIERVLIPNGFLFVVDLRRSWAGLIEREIRSALTLEEAKDLFSRSKLREGVFSRSFLWWRFET
jgi:ubiquinone/menaquinone biosynthesis C-methylase UbiE